jgi:hypothetical protein
MIPLSKAFPDEPLHSIANHRIAHLRTNGNSQAGFRSIGFSRNDYEISGVLLFAGAREMDKFRSFPKAGLFGKTRSDRT